MDSFSNKHILVLGLGLHGGAIENIKWLSKQGASITVSDTKTQEQLTESVAKLSGIQNITFHFGNQDDLDLSEIDLVLRNPAVPRKAPIIMRAREAGIPVMMDSSIFFEQIGTSNIIGITGSKGKTTTSHAIGYILQTLAPSTIVVGVDGVSPLGELEKVSPTALVVFELSSWRLEALQERQLSPHIAVVTSIYKDHLNTYGSYEEYIEVKKQIIASQVSDDIAILNADDDIINKWKESVRGVLYWFSLQPLPHEEKGIWVDGERVYAHIDHETIQICLRSDIPHTSDHELRNKLPSILIALLYDFSIPDTVETAKHIPPLQHRLQLVRTINNVAYVNDSAATMPDATIAALQSFSNKQIVLILGGSDKALEFDRLAQQISQSNIRHLIWLPGTATERMQAIILPTTQATSHNASTMQEAVTIAQEIADAGDTVLMSPGATSFGLFLHEFDRGNAFIQAVEQL